MEEACKSLKLVRFFIFSPLSFSSRRFFFVGRVLAHRFHRYTQIFYGISGESLCQSQGVSVTTGQVASAKIRE